MSSRLWSWQDLCGAMGLPPVAGPAVTGIQIDSRLLKPGDLFVALKGDPGPRFTVTERSDRDGYDFVPAAVAAGAAGVIVSQLHPQVPAAVQLRVADTLDALWQLGAARRQALFGPVVAVTGSSGKTTCKTFLKAALQGFASEGSLNNHLGVPLSLARTPTSEQPCIYELGMNHPGEIAPLSQLVRPHLAVVLNVHDAHAAAFVDRAAIRSEKLSICAGLEGPRQLIVEDSVDTSEVPSNVQISTFGESEQAAVRLLSVQGDLARYRLLGEGEGAQATTVAARVPGGGRHRALTLAAVLAVTQALQLDPGPALALRAALLPRGRGSRSVHGGIELIDDSYNANPASMAAALQALAAEPGRCYAVLGEMLELGQSSAQQHRALASACNGLDGVLLVGEGMRALRAALPQPQCLGWWPEATGAAAVALIDVLQATLNEGDKLLIKGSNRVFWKQDFVAEIGASLT